MLYKRVVSVKGTTLFLVKETVLFGFLLRNQLFSGG